MPPDPSTILLGTVAMEPNRWGFVHADRRATIDLADWLAAIAEAGFDGLELWDGHDTAAVRDHPLPVQVFNSYASLDDPDDRARRAVADAVRVHGSSGVKCNTGNDPAREGQYADRMADWIDRLPAETALLCECHEGISIAADPLVAARIFERAGPPSRMQAIVHTHEPADDLRRRFDAYGDRITHVHVNHLDDRGAPPLAECADALATRIDLFRSLGFAGTWTIEFVAGVLTDHDRPEHLVAQAASDLRTLRELLAGSS